MQLKKVWNNKVYEAYVIEGARNDIYVYFYNKLVFIIEPSADYKSCHLISVRDSIGKLEIDFAYEVLDHMQ